jgi:hypothetical protein
MVLGEKLDGNLSVKNCKFRCDFQDPAQIIKNNILLRFAVFE